MKPHIRRRLWGALALLLGAGAATGLSLMALGDTLSYYRTASEIVSGAYPEKLSGRPLRLGGLVKEGSLTRRVLPEGGEDARFQVTDGLATLTVHYRGLIPDLFKEKQGVIVEGRMENDAFEAATLLAKHDENYTPPGMPQRQTTPQDAQ